MIKRLRILPIAALAILGAVTAFALKPQRASWDDEAARRKAESLYYEAQTAYALDDYGRYITLVQRAFELDSTNPGNTTEWALITIHSYEDTLLPQHVRAYNYLTKNFFEHPDNYNTGEILADVSMHLDRTDVAVRVWEVLDSVFPRRTDTGVNLAKAYLYHYYNGDSASYDKALAIYRRIEEGTGPSIELSTARIGAYMLRGDTAGIVNEAQTLAAHMPDNSNAMLFAAGVLQIVDSNRLSLPYIDRACQIDSTNGEAFLARAEYYRDMGDSAAFDREVFHALRSRGLEVESKVQILRSYVAELFTDSTQQGRIRELFGELQQVNAGEPQIHSLYGAYLMAVGEQQEAVEQLAYAVELNPTDISAWYSLMQTAAVAEDTATLIHYGPQAIERVPDELYFPIVLADAYRRNGQTQTAVEVMESVEIPEIRNAKAVSNFISIKGDMYASAGDTIRALEIYDEAIDLDPENYMALNNAAYFMAENGIDLDKAESYSARTIADDPTKPTYLDTYAWVFFKKKDYKMARHYIDLALKYYSHPELQGAPAEDDTDSERMMPGEQEEAANISEEDGDDGDDGDGDGEKITFDVYDHAGDIYFMNQEPARALEFWEKALALEPGNELVARKVKYKTLFFK